jgi:hypothetical protein
MGEFQRMSKPAIWLPGSFSGGIDADVVVAGEQVAEHIRGCTPAARRRTARCARTQLDLLNGMTRSATP